MKKIVLVFAMLMMSLVSFGQSEEQVGEISKITISLISKYQSIISVYYEDILELTIEDVKNGNNSNETKIKNLIYEQKKAFDRISELELQLYFVNTNLVEFNKIKNK